MDEIGVDRFVVLWNPSLYDVPVGERMVAEIMDVPSQAIVEKEVK